MHSPVSSFWIQDWASHAVSVRPAPSIFLSTCCAWMTPLASGTYSVVRTNQPTNSKPALGVAVEPVTSTVLVASSGPLTVVSTVPSTAV